jgi:hypothetical protein
MVCFEMGSEMTLDWGMSMRVLPSLERHMREAVWVGGPPASGLRLGSTLGTRRRRRRRYWRSVAHSGHKFSTLCTVG